MALGLALQLLRSRLQSLLVHLQNRSASEDRYVQLDKQGDREVKIDTGPDVPCLDQDIPDPGHGSQVCPNMDIGDSL